jgi:hypothetical protein
VREIENPTFLVTSKIVKVTWVVITERNESLRNGEFPKLSQICDLRKPGADHLRISRISFALFDKGTKIQIDDEDCLADHLRKTEVSVAIGLLKPPVHQLCFRAFETHIILEYLAETLFINLTKPFQRKDEIVVFEIDGKIIDSQCKAS